MLDLYAECPKCHSRLAGRDEECPNCHKRYAARRAHLLRDLSVAGFGVAVMAFFAVGTFAPRALPASLRAVMAGKSAEQLVPDKAEPWAYGGVEPEARSWGYKLEPSLAGACNATYARAIEPKYLGGFLSPRLAAREQAALPPLAPGEKRKAVWRKLTPEEQADVVAAMGEQEQFLGSCLRWGYEAIAPCSRLHGNLKGPNAEACLLPPVQRALTIEPWKRCAAAAKLPQIQVACADVAEAMQRWTDRPAPAGM